MNIDLRKPLPFLEEIVSCLEANEHLWNGDASTLEKHKGYLKEIILDIKKEEEHHSMSMTVLQITNCRLKFEIAKDISSLDSALEALAQSKDDQDLIEEAATNHLDYMMLESDAFEQKVNNRLTLLQEYYEQLKEYGVEEEQLAIIKGKIRQHHNDEKKLTKELPRQFYSKKEQEIDLLIKKIDPIITKFQAKHTVFHKAYFCIREKYTGIVVPCR